MMPGSQTHAQGGLKRRRWSPEEDQRLIAYMKRHPENGGWRNVPMLAGLNRCGKSCRLRWNNYLRSGLKKENFTQEEENKILSLQRLLGNKWALIAAQLPGRTDIQIKNYWNSRLKKKLATKKDVPTTTQTTLSQKSLVATDLFDSTQLRDLHLLHNPVSQGFGYVTPNPQVHFNELVGFNSTGPVQALPPTLPAQGTSFSYQAMENPIPQLSNNHGVDFINTQTPLPSLPPQVVPSFTYQAMEDPTFNNYPHQFGHLITNIANTTSTDLGSFFGNVPNETTEIFRQDISLEYLSIAHPESTLL